MNLRFETNFLVMPHHCNHHDEATEIFGGSFFGEIDKAGYCCVCRLLQDSECDSCVTHKVLEGAFHAAAYRGDLIFLEAEVVELRKKAVVVEVKAFREKQAIRGRDYVAKWKFVFVTKKDGKFHHHGLTLP